MSINEGNNRLVKPNMIFHVRIVFQDITKKISRSIIAIGDTVLINSEGRPQVLTAGIQKKYKEISYSLDDDVRLYICYKV